jgi:hypothetical protein
MIFTILFYVTIIGLIFYAIERLTEDDKCQCLVMKTWCVFNPVSCALMDNSNRNCSSSNSESKNESIDKPKNNSNKK